MNFQKTQLNYNNIYPYVLSGEMNKYNETKSSTYNDKLYPAVCYTNLDEYYKNKDINLNPELDCPNASNTNKIYSNYTQLLQNNYTNDDMKWNYVKYSKNNLDEQKKCIPQFMNTINICTPKDCILKKNDKEYTKYYECNKIFNNSTKRKFIDNRINK